LAAPITETEVAKAIASLNPNKAPGPDGPGGLFYQIHSTRLVPFLTKLLNHFLKGVAIPPAIKEAVITTNYKGKGDPLDISNRRPIAFLKVDYKILSNIISNGILCLLPRLILPNQTGFVPGRSIFDNIVTMNASFDFSKLSPNDQHPKITFIDFEKAFDSLSHAAVKKGPLRMALDRLQQPLSKGGLAPPNLETLHTAMLVWLLERTARIQSLLFIYSLIAPQFRRSLPLFNPNMSADSVNRCGKKRTEFFH
jgi:hypothetical protein